MTQIYESYSLHWQNIEIEIRYCGSWSKSFADTYGHDLRHIEVHTISPKRAALPITETGYKSIFLNFPATDSESDPVSFVREVLDDAALSTEWINQKEAARQMALF